MLELIFKASKKEIDQISIYNFFPIYQNVNRILSKKQRKAFKRTR